jgi:acyl carrier protein
MKAHFEGTYSAEELEGFADKRATDLLNESIDVVEFLVYLEDELGSRIDATQVGPALANMTFGELAAKVCDLLDEEQGNKP